MTAPRVILQCVFLVMIGRVLSGTAGAQYGFVGCAAFATSSITIVGVCDVTVEDVLSGTYHQIQRGVLRPSTVYLCRVLPYIVDGVIASVLALALAGPILGMTRSALDLAPLLPLYLLTSVTSAMMGLAIAGLASIRSADVLLGNFATYIVLAAAGVVTPAPRSLAWLSAIGEILPLDHGLAAARASLAGRPWAGECVLECAVGFGWAALAISILQIRDGRARR